MGRKKIDRTGEENVNTFGSKMVIVAYRGVLDIDIYFPSIIGLLNMQNIVILKKEKSNVLMKKGILALDI